MYVLVCVYLRVYIPNFKQMFYVSPEINCSGISAACSVAPAMINSSLRVYLCFKAQRSADLVGRRFRGI